MASAFHLPNVGDGQSFDLQKWTSMNGQIGINGPFDSADSSASLRTHPMLHIHILRWAKPMSKARPLKNELSNWAGCIEWLGVIDIFSNYLLLTK
jgi:hypothetical protein